MIGRATAWLSRGPLPWRTRSGRVVLLLAALAVMAGGMWVGRGALGARDRTWTRIRETGVWRVGMDPSFPPFENLDVTTGEPAGFDVDLARALAGQWGVRVEFVGVGFDQLLDAVAAHRVDSALSALPVAMHRTREMQFSEPYIEAGMVLALPAGSALQTTVAASRGLPDTALAGLRIAAEWGSEGDALARGLQTRAAGNLKLVLRDSTEAALRAVIAGEADAAIVDAIGLALFDRGTGRLVAVDPPLRSEPYAIVVPMDTPELLRQINEGLAALQADGTVREIRQHWLGTTE